MGVDAEYRTYAIEAARKRVHEVEETITTPAMRHLEAEDPGRRLIGLTQRLKPEDRLMAKAEFHLRASPEISWEEAFRKVTDAIRYTLQYPAPRYAEGVHADCARLRAAGFEPVDLRNSWGTGECQGIDSRWRVPGSGQLFEVQFHTPASFAARRLTHGTYDLLRDPATPKSERAVLRAYQREVNARVPVPPGATAIPGYR